MRRPVVLMSVAALAAGLLAWGAGPSVAEDVGAQAITPASPAVNERAPRASAAATFGFVGRAVVGVDAGLDSDAEVAAISGSSLFVIDREVSGETAQPGIRRFNIGDPANPKRGPRVDLSAYGADINSVAASGNYVMAALQSDPKTAAGTVVLMRWDGRAFNIVRQVKAGALPDMVAFSPDGRKALVANEGEPSCYGDGCIDPEGSLTLIDVEAMARGSKGAARQVTFNTFNTRASQLRKAGVRIFGPGATVAQDLEPEYVAFDPANGNRAWVTLQENNALATVDLTRGVVTGITALGTKNHNAGGNGLDASDRDNRVNIRNWPVRGMYMPDAIATYVVNGQTYIVSANEGDARDYDGFAEELRVGDDEFNLNPSTFPDVATLKEDRNLGRLTVTMEGARKKGGYVNEILAFGGRSISIWGAGGRQVWDSGDALEAMTAARLPRYFNSTNDEVEFDNRSDNKGPEPEGVAVGTIGKITYAFAALERIGGLAVFDITDPKRGKLLQYLNTRDFLQDAAPDAGAETVSFVPASKSPNGKPLVAVSNEVSGTVTLWQPVNPDGAAELTLLHNNDGESSLFSSTNTVGEIKLPVGSVAAFSSVTQREVANARSLGNSVVNVYAGDSFLASSLLACSLPPAPTSTPVYDAVAQRLLPYDVHVFGNHEFDFGPDFLKRYVMGFTNGTAADQPFISGNLDFGRDAAWSGLVDNSGTVVTGQIASGRVVGKAAIVYDIVTGQRFGIVSATTPNLPTISSPAPVAVTTTDVSSTAALVQRQVDAMKSAGVTKVIFVSHLQSLANDKEIVRLLSGIDIAVAGGGDDQLANSPTVLLPGDPAPVGTYPTDVPDKSGVTVPIVTTAGNYKYVGRLDARFDAKGNLTSYDLATSYPRRVIPASSAATTLGLEDAVEPDELMEERIQPAADCLAANSTAIAATDVLLNVARGSSTAPGVRTQETNGGDLIADGFMDSYDRYAARAGLKPRSATNLVAAIQNGGGIRQTGGDTLPTNGSAPGSISRNNTLDLLAFLTNVMTVVPDLSPSEMKEVFERSLGSGFSGAKCTGSGGGQFLQVSQLRVIADCSKTAQVVTSAGEITMPGERIRYLAFDPGTPAVTSDDVVLVRDGAVVAGAPTVSLVTNSFTAGGGDNYPTLAKKKGIQLGATYEQALVEYLLAFPKVGGLPTIPSSSRYAKLAGEGRITFS
jgi:2',3'-cyclic-nucleotide 2'-phosphodiesterase (5'-nucleotidase family)